ncbi:DUF4190 domain-containing protein [Xylanimonas oleitrophica]|uniref:DUF4190 domain-containing protein n=1 Tax=Xylanimonas oleitrophica TaxID=2607479 RepID=UPI0015CFBD9E|nr:DUF4190 domain-containing protein [Xylanimonas oleitrophica]
MSDPYRPTPSQPDRPEPYSTGPHSTGPYSPATPPQGATDPSGSTQQAPGASPHATSPGAATPYAASQTSPYDSPPGGFYGTLQSQGTDGVSIAALVTGVLGLGVVPVVLGIVGLNRVRNTGRQGKGLAVAGIVLGGISIVVGAFLVVLMLLGLGAAGGWALLEDDGFEQGQTYGDNATLDALWDGCAAGDMAACDDLYESSEIGSEYEQFGETCGGRQEPAWSCS